MLQRLLTWLTLSFALFAPLTAQAHSMFQSSVLLDMHSNSIEIELQLPPSRLGDAMGFSIAAETLASRAQAIQEYCATRIKIRDIHGNAWAMSEASAPEWKVVDGAPYVVLHLTAEAPHDTDKRHFQVEDHIITDRLPSNAILVTVRSDWEGDTFASEPDLVGILSGENSLLPVDLGPGSWAKGFGSVFHLGIRHIAEGTDHLLFLLVLLLPAPLGHLGRRWSGHIAVRPSILNIVKIATAFTIGHSITLALAAFGVVHTPARPIEVLIAVSILISALHAMRPIFPGREMFVAAGFGLIHGLAFATTLSDLGLRGWERLQGILAFNLGIETMQLVVIACVMPSLVLLSRTRFYGVFRWLGAAFAALSACGWIVERSLNISLGIDHIVDALSTHSVALAVTLFAVSLLCWRLLPADAEPRHSS